jgi:hypothetical protein
MLPESQKHNQSDEEKNRLKLNEKIPSQYAKYI